MANSFRLCLKQENGGKFGQAFGRIELYMMVGKIIVMAHLKNIGMLPDELGMKAEDLSLRDEATALILQCFEDNRAISPTQSKIFKMNEPWVVPSLTEIDNFYQEAVKVNKVFLVLLLC